MNRKIAGVVLATGSLVWFAMTRVDNDPGSPTAPLPRFASPLADSPVPAPDTNPEHVPEMWDEFYLKVFQDPTLGAARQFDIVAAAYHRYKSSDVEAGYLVDLIAQIGAGADPARAAWLRVELLDPMTSATLRLHLLGAIDSVLESPDGMRREALMSAVRDQTGSQHAPTAAEALQVYSRHAPLAEASAMLAFALRHDQIDIAGYAHALGARLQDTDDGVQQLTVIDMLLAAANGSSDNAVHATVIDSIQSALPSMRGTMSVPAPVHAMLADYLHQHEPQFSGDPDDFDMVDAVRFSHWLDTLAQLAPQESDMVSCELMLQHVLELSADPRKLAALLLSDRREAILRTARAQGNLSMIRERLTQAAAVTRAGGTANEVLAGLLQHVE